MARLSPWLHPSVQDSALVVAAGLLMPPAVVVALAALPPLSPLTSAAAVADQDLPWRLLASAVVAGLETVLWAPGLLKVARLSPWLHPSAQDSALVVAAGLLMPPEVVVALEASVFLPPWVLAAPMELLMVQEVAGAGH